MLWALYKYLMYILNKFVDVKLFEYSWNQMITLKLKTERGRVAIHCWRISFSAGINSSEGVVVLQNTQTTSQSSSPARCRPCLRILAIFRSAALDEAAFLLSFFSLSVLFLSRRFFTLGVYLVYTRNARRIEKKLVSLCATIKELCSSLVVVVLIMHEGVHRRKNS